MKTPLLPFLGLISMVGLCAGSLADEPVSATHKVKPFALQQVDLLDGPFKAAAERDRRYLHDLESDRLLHFFRVTAGRPSSAEPMGGWERKEVRGHTMGHYLSACALTVAATGDSQLKRKADGIVAELAKCQQALGDSGYLSAFPESFIDRVEAQKPVWAPYYTLHKIMAGLLDMHIHTGNLQAIAVVTGMADWCKGRCDRLSDERMQAMLNTTEQGGMNDVLAHLYAVTGNEDYLTLARRFVQRSYNGPLAKQRDELMGQHANSFIPNMIGTARLYEVGGDEADRKIAQFFWNQVTSARCYCTGGMSNREHWQSPPNQLAHELGDHTQETCCTYNMLKLTRHLFCWQPDARYADYYEQALYNSILSTQDPATGMMMYFVSLGSGRWKYYNTPRDSFWCCTGTGLENHAKYGESIYFHDDEGVYVNLFIPSELDWVERGVKIRQETAFPEVSATSLTIDAASPVEFTLRVRVPGWAKGGVEMTLNGKRFAQTAGPSSYFELKRTWRAGDRVELDMPMSLTVWPMPDEPALTAFMVGPLVLAARLDGEGLTDEMVYTTENWYKFPANQVVETGPLLTDTDDPRSVLAPLENQPLTFRTMGQEQELTFVPYHKLFGERYAVYWHVYQRGSEAHRLAVAEAEAAVRFRERVIDEVTIGDGHSERAHAMKGKEMASGIHMGRRWRHASSNGFFSFQMKVCPDSPTELSCSYWGSDSGKRRFNILVDGERIATEQLDNNRPGEFFDVIYAIPENLTVEKEQVTVRFEPQAGQMAGGVFRCCTLKGEKN